LQILIFSIASTQNCKMTDFIRYLKKNNEMFWFLTLVLVYDYDLEILKEKFKDHNSLSGYSPKASLNKNKG